MSLDETHRPRVESAFADRALLSDPDHRYAIEGTLAALDRGELRVASPPPSRAATGSTHAWVKQAILLYFAIRRMEKHAASAPSSSTTRSRSRRTSSPTSASCRRASRATARSSSRACILMPGYVNIGARVGAGTMVDTWATVGSCAQIGRDCHLAGGVGIGGVLEPPSRAAGHRRGRRLHRLARGHRRGRARRPGGGHRRGVVLTSSTAIIDVTGPQAVETAAACRRAASSSRASGRRVPRRRVRRAVRAHHRQAQRDDRPEGEPQRGPARLRGAGVSRRPRLETLLWLCAIPSPIGEERALCDAVQARLGRARPSLRRLDRRPASPEVRAARRSPSSVTSTPCAPRTGRRASRATAASARARAT